MTALIIGALVTGWAGLPDREESFEPQTIRFDSTAAESLPLNFSIALTGGGAHDFVGRADRPNRA